MKIGIYSGAFDPIHDGHIQVAKCALTVCDQVLVMPDYVSGYHKKMADFNDRVDMCLYATEWFGESIEWSRFGMDLEFTGRSYDNMVKIRDKYKEFDIDVELYFIVGEDTARYKVKKWYKSEELRNEFPFITVSRPRGVDPSEVSPKWYLESPHIYIKQEEDYTNITSTYIRAAINTNTEEKIIKWLNPDVLEHIKQRKLYQS